MAVQNGSPRDYLNKLVVVFGYSYVELTAKAAIVRFGVTDRIYCRIITSPEGVQIYRGDSYKPMLEALRNEYKLKLAKVVQL
ncbi:hypothetical protein COPG_00144 [Colwellia phage 9A]|uniref:Uncharacterized protein n=1 Tax=Colwellia phage 9A TaxID=765765 RepID=I3UMM5_9CAUD|nr:hypothetical protein COPG_00144 [Colwellia phage 9A]AFK66740.1 hypothetical protein COPG_00144 [Colwellia phage 9A]